MADKTQAELKADAEAEEKAAQKKLTDDRYKEIDGKKDLDDDEKQILKLYNDGVQNYEIAKKVYKFVNQDTVGKVILTIRKEHADDFNKVEDINATKGYTGVGR
jgi:DNA-binding NarL/FixJ family response regulator